MADSKKKNQTGEKAKNELRSVRMSYILPIILGIIFIILELYGIWKGTNAHAIQYNIEGEGINYTDCILDLFIGYIPSSVLALMFFAVMQQQMYGVYSGLNKNKIVVVHLTVSFYLLYYGVFLVVGCLSEEKWAVMIVTIIFCLYTWFRLLDRDIRKIGRSRVKRPKAITGNC